MGKRTQLKSTKTDDTAVEEGAVMVEEVALDGDRLLHKGFASHSRGGSRLGLRHRVGGRSNFQGENSDARTWVGPVVLQQYL